MRRATTFVAATVLCLAGQLGFAQSELDRYLEKIRESGITEQGWRSLWAGARILSGADTLVVQQQPDGALRRLYSSAFRPRPGADREKLQALEEQTAPKTERWLGFLKKRADADGSGFVSSGEGQLMRDRVELGVIVVQVPELSLDELAKGMNANRERLAEDLAAYAKLQPDSIEQGLEGMPALPVAMARQGKKSNSTPQPSSTPSDLEQCVQKIRGAGMTEEAEGSLHMTASMLSGGINFHVRPASDGSIGRSYQTPSLFRSAGDIDTSEALQREKIEANTARWIPLLKEHADADQSGFVSSQEGQSMRDRVELGLVVVQVPQIESLNDLAKALRKDRKQLVAELAAYARLQAESVEQGLEGMPALPGARAPLGDI